jgi:hypothetical protein
MKLLLAIGTGKEWFPMNGNCFLQRAFWVVLPLFPHFQAKHLFYLEMVSLAMLCFMCLSA